MTQQPPTGLTAHILSQNFPSIKERLNALPYHYSKNTKEFQCRQSIRNHATTNFRSPVVIQEGKMLVATSLALWRTVFSTIMVYFPTAPDHPLILLFFFSYLLSHQENSSLIQIQICTTFEYLATGSLGKLFTQLTQVINSIFSSRNCRRKHHGLVAQCPTEWKLPLYIIHEKLSSNSPNTCCDRYSLTY